MEMVDAPRAALTGARDVRAAQRGAASVVPPWETPSGSLFRHVDSDGSASSVREFVDMARPSSS